MCAVDTFSAIGGEDGNVQIHYCSAEKHNCLAATGVGVVHIK